MADYKLTTGSAIIRTSDGVSFLPDNSNVDYQEYLAWVAAGNTADAAQTALEIKQSKLSELNLWFESEKASLRKGITDLNLADGTEVTMSTKLTSLQSSFSTLKSTYNTKLVVIKNG